MSSSGDPSAAGLGGDDASGGMDIGSLHRLSLCDSGGDACFQQALQEASVVDARRLMADPIVSDVRLGMQLGSISVREGYSLTACI